MANSLAQEKKVSSKKTATKATAQAVVSGVGKESSHSKTVANRRTVTGLVVSDKMDKTIVVKVDRRVRHPLYKKYVTNTCKYQAHDEKEAASVGDLVQLVESRPLSRHKRWALQKVVRRSALAPEISLAGEE